MGALCCLIFLLSCTCIIAVLYALMRMTCKSSIRLICLIKELLPGTVLFFFLKKRKFILEYYDLYIIQASTATLKYRDNNNIIFQYLLSSTVFEKTPTILL